MNILRGLIGDPEDYRGKVCVEPKYLNQTQLDRIFAWALHLGHCTAIIKNSFKIYESYYWFFFCIFL